MRRMIAIAALLLLTGTTAYAADVESRLPSDTPERIRAGIREATQAGVDPNGIVALTARMMESRFREPLIVQALETVKAARQEGLPVEPIVNKAYEGIAKRVEAEKTVQAMEAVRSRYSVAFGTAGTYAADQKQRLALGTTIAEGLAAGIQEKDLGRIKEKLQQQSQQLSLHQMFEVAVQSFQTVREMARLGVSSATAGDVVCQALQHQFTAREMAQLRSAFTAEAGQRKAESVAQQYGAQISGGARAGGVGAAGVGSGPAGTGAASGAGSGGSGGHGGAGGSGGGGGGRR